ncbi:MAG: hypothetical protein ACREA9_21055 [Pyrinomonadaceae bacterium]
MNRSESRPVKIRPVDTGDYTGGLFAFVLVASVVVAALFHFVA